jgi:deoxyribose-phosphate aldolase
MTSAGTGIELALLRADVTRDELRAACRHALEAGAASVLVHTSNVLAARAALDGESVAVIAAVDFPLGAADMDAKRYAVEVAVDHDAQALLVVANHALLREKAWDAFSRELRDLVEAADERPLSLLLETSLLDDETLARAANLAHEAQAKGVTLSAMFGTRDVPPERLRTLRAALAPGAQLKLWAAAPESAVALRELGADRVIVNHPAPRL